MDHTASFIVRRISDGRFLAVDSYSGGYPCYTDRVMAAERFSLDKRAVDYLLSVKSDGPFTVHEVLVGEGITVGEFEEMAKVTIRENVLAKLTMAERRALGVE